MIQYDAIKNDFSIWLDGVRAKKRSHLVRCAKKRKPLDGYENALGKLFDKAVDLGIIDAKVNIKDLNWLIAFKDKVENDSSIPFAKLRDFEQGNSHRSGKSALNYFVEYIKTLLVTSIDSVVFRESANPIDPPRYGSDGPCGNVSYEQNVEDDEKVPGLCEMIYSYFRDVLTFAFKKLDIFNKNLLQGDFPPIFLSKECPVDTYENDDPYVSEKVAELAKDGELSKSNILNIIYSFDRRTGCFSPNPVRMVVYYKNIPWETSDEYYKTIAQVVAHEYLHYLEYKYLRSQGVTPFTDARVSEALADFFAFLFSINRGDTAIAKHRYIAWLERWGSSWPYAYAKCFLPNEYVFSDDIDEYYRNGSINKFIDVFGICNNPKKAFDMLNKFLLLE